MKETIRKQMGLTPYEIQKVLIDEEPTDKMYGNFTGIVINNNDPEKQGKCRIRVYGVFGDEVPDSDLPWALPDFNNVGSLVGSFTVPPVGALVKVYFDRGDVYLPHYTTKAVKSNKQPTQKDKDYPNNIVLIETDDGDYITFNRKTKVLKVYHNTGSQFIINKEGEAVIHSAPSVRLDSTTQVILGDSGGYVVTAPTPGQIVTQSGAILTAQAKIRA
jgi:hypothetical protein